VADSTVCTTVQAAIRSTYYTVTNHMHEALHADATMTTNAHGQAKYIELSDVTKFSIYGQQVHSAIVWGKLF